MKRSILVASGLLFVLACSRVPAPGAGDDSGSADDSGTADDSGSADDSGAADDSGTTDSGEPVEYEWNDVAAGAYATCALTVGGDIVCWGAEHEALTADDRRIVTDAPTGAGYTGISASKGACALDASSKPVCWGDDELLDPPDDSLRYIEVGWEFACGIRAADGTVVCWGDAPILSQLPEDLGDPTRDWQEVQIGYTKGDVLACALDGTGHVKCWGGGYWPFDSADPEDVYTTISVGGIKGCGLTPAGRIDCWGAEYPSYEPAEQPPDGLLLSEVALSFHGTWACGISQDTSRVTCWGDFSEFTSRPTMPVARLSGGGWHFCALTGDAELRCWIESSTKSTGAADPP